MLAIDGGVPVRTTPIPAWPHFAEDEVEAVATVLRSGKVNYWTGELGKRFEQEFSRFHGNQHAIALANGTVALELALYALDIGPGDEVIVPAKTFIATASCVVMRGATPVVVDIEPDSQNISLASIEKALTARTKAIIAVHLGGWPCEMDAILDFARQHGLRVIEDCAQAIGAEYKGKPVGSFGDAAAFSFCQDKIITTGGEGGMLLLKEESAWRKAWAFKDHGKDYNLVAHATHPPGHRWLHTSFGTNWRMTEMQAAIGLLQLQKLPDWLAVRRAHAATLTHALRGIPALDVPARPDWISDAYYRLYAFIRPEVLNTGWSQDRIVEAINAEGVSCFHGSCSEIYRERAFAALVSPSMRLKNARRTGETSIAFLVHPTLSAHDIAQTAEAACKIFRHAGR